MLGLISFGRYPGVGFWIMRLIYVCRCLFSVDIAQPFSKVVSPISSATSNKRESGTSHFHPQLVLTNVFIFILLWILLWRYNISKWSWGWWRTWPNNQCFTFCQLWQRHLEMINLEHKGPFRNKVHKNDPAEYFSSFFKL